MADHTPDYLTGAAVTFLASADVTGGQLVAISGNESVAPTSAATAAWRGVAAFDAKAGDGVTVLSGGVHTLTSTGAIAAGAVVIAAAGGKVAAIGSGTDYSQVVGIAEAAAANNKVRVKLAR
ncbi:capsid cement protein [Prescottella equi]|uniref:capsid cement protein n=1 Tax=Rhodococcus hoagii TaxID=43767 RepID=UPI0007CD82B4|nr:capsid cement protein [Prescottella equi]ORL01558.1 hypothetical protein A6F56_04360 [Prescottella equi]